MSGTLWRRATFTACAAGLAALAACADTPTAPTPMARPSGLAFEYGDANKGQPLVVCKMSGPIGSYDFTVQVTGGGPYTLPNTNAFSIYYAPTLELWERCRYAYLPLNQAAWTGVADATVVLSEVNLPAGVQVDSIYYWNAYSSDSARYGVGSLTLKTGYLTWWWVKYFNGTSEAGHQGCTPGFWKQKQHFQYWVGYTQAQPIGSVFSGTAGYAVNGAPMGGYSLLQGLSFKGGNTIDEAAEILMRAGIAALLNAANPDAHYAYSTSQVISQVNAALATRDRTTILSLAGELDFQNNRGCTVKD